ncbi:MAG: Uma2 family endonuclease [Pirellulaceae bacterium]|nr:Uma2 family endonuclease [Pirellulaceae bacterium]
MPEYWIVNLLDRCIEVHLAPAGGEYARSCTYDATSSLAPHAAPQSPLRVAAALP